MTFDTFVDALTTWALTGPWDRASVEARFARCLDRDDLSGLSWLSDLADQLTRGRRDADRVWTHIADAAEQAIEERKALPRVVRWPLDPQAMRASPAGLELPTLEGPDDLARVLEVPRRHLEWLADLRGLNPQAEAHALQHYVRRWVPKRSGGARLLESPKPTLKRIQRRLLDAVLRRWPPHAAACGFEPGRGVLDHARAHAGQALVVRMDLSDFFGSIGFARVRAAFGAIGYPPGVARALAGLTVVSTPERYARRLRRWLPPSEAFAAAQRLRAPHLPQGAPTSPALANRIARRLDQRLSGLAARFGGTYTRYADDLAFSGGAAFAKDVGRLLPRAGAVILEEGFVPNHRKTRVMRASQRQELCGIVVNAGPSLPRAELERLEAILVNCARQGPASQNRGRHPDLRAHLEGRVAWVTQVHPAKGARLQRWLDRIDWSPARP